MIRCGHCAQHGNHGIYHFTHERVEIDFGQEDESAGVFGSHVFTTRAVCFHSIYWHCDTAKATGIIPEFGQQTDFLA